MSAPPFRLISGGQTGVDRGALDAALTLAIPIGGWCPRDRRAEDGPLDERYVLTETSSRSYRQRTEWNVRDADLTLILSPSPLTSGTLLTAKLAASLDKPVVTIDPYSFDASASIARELRRHQPEVLNVAGPRESLRPGIQTKVNEILLQALANR